MTPAIALARGEFVVLAAGPSISGALFWWLRGVWDRARRSDELVVGYTELHPLPRPSLVHTLIRWWRS